jgi:hypothetical protein
MRRFQGKIEENTKEDPVSEPDKAPNTWLVEDKLNEDIPDWEKVSLENGANSGI